MSLVLGHTQERAWARNDLWCKNTSWKPHKGLRTLLWWGYRRARTLRHCLKIGARGEGEPILGDSSSHRRAAAPRASDFLGAGASQRFLEPIEL
ncbi:unnamed protein product [Prorocentrum cordatum]|uniref:Uncharacterized protein n=1 Tax=Prorocentrum cordatum TaxID=2364126 RepID=A0ABN9SBK6_9DINO|nr:unnamed protein product [Polarella glacialis]